MYIEKWTLIMVLYNESTYSLVCEKEVYINELDCDHLILVLILCSHSAYLLLLQQPILHYFI